MRSHHQNRALNIAMIFLCPPPCHVAAGLLVGVNTPMYRQATDAIRIVAEIDMTGIAVIIATGRGIRVEGFLIRGIEVAAEAAIGIEVAAEAVIVTVTGVMIPVIIMMITIIGTIIEINPVNKRAIVNHLTLQQCHQVFHQHHHNQREKRLTASML